MAAVSQSSGIVIRQLVNPPSVVLDEAARVLVEAFENDFFTTNLLGGSQDGQLAFLLQRCQLAAAIIGGEVYVAEIPEHNESGEDSSDRKIVAAAVWFPPGREMLDKFRTVVFEDQHKAGADDFLSRLNPELAKWWQEVFFPGFDALATEAFGPGQKLASWHLLQLGVQPSYWRRGIASKLIDAVKIKASNSKSRITLETESQLNTTIYERIGFQIRGETEMTGLVGKFPVYAMMAESGSEEERSHTSN